MEISQWEEQDFSLDIDFTRIGIDAWVNSRQLPYSNKKEF